MTPLERILALFAHEGDFFHLFLPTVAYQLFICNTAIPSCGWIRSHRRKHMGTFSLRHRRDDRDTGVERETNQRVPKATFCTSPDSALQSFHVLDQPQWIKNRNVLPPLLLDLVREHAREQDTLPRRFRLVIDPTLMLALTLPGLEFHRRLMSNIPGCVVENLRGEGRRCVLNSRSAVLILMVRSW